MFSRSSKNVLSFGSLNVSTSPKSIAKGTVDYIDNGKSGILLSSNFVDFIETPGGRGFMVSIWRVSYGK